MTTRGDATRARLTSATRQVVAEVGYARATTKSIAQAAGVSEGTIYRHFPDKHALFAEAILESNQHIASDLEALPARAGTGTVETNLTDALVSMASLRDAVLPLELALLAEPVPERGAAVQAHLADGTALPGPPGAIAAYLRAEQALGRVRADANCEMAAMTLMSSVVGMALLPMPADRQSVDAALIATAAGIFARGLAP